MVEHESQSRTLEYYQDSWQSRSDNHGLFLSGVGVMILIFVDQITKWWVSQVSLVSLNQGLAFGLRLPSTLLLLLIMVLILVVGWGWWRIARVTCNGQILTKKQSLQLIGYSMILAGGISNLIDRLIWGGVRDWLPIPWTPLHNNLADWMIVIGCLGLVWSIGRHRRRRVAGTTSDD